MLVFLLGGWVPSLICKEDKIVAGRGTGKSLAETAEQMSRVDESQEVT